MAGWNDLPLELRWIILDYIHDLLSECTTFNFPYPQLPLVCREWYYRFAHEPFSTTVLDQDRLDDFKKFVGNNEPRQAYVSRIVLRIRLPEYDCTACQTSEDWATAQLNDIIFLTTLQKLMAILSTWKIVERRDNGLELDIGVYSPSDGQHGFRDCRLSRGYRYGAGQEVHDRYDPANHNPPASGSGTCPGWNRACHYNKPAIESKRRLLAVVGDPWSLHFAAVFGCRAPKGFACAPVIRHLTIRRQYYRHISPVILSRLIEKTPNLRTLRNETWVHPDIPVQSRFQRGYMDMLLALPSSIRSVHLFCDSSGALPCMGVTSQTRVVGAELGRSLAEAASGLSSCSASFFLEAEDFLRHSSQGQIAYPNLKVLMLTSRRLGRVDFRPYDTATTNLLLAAAKTAFHNMPKLQILDLWYAKHEDALLFRFFQLLPETEEQTTELCIFWHSTWHYDDELSGLFREVRSMWRSIEPHRNLHFIREPFTKRTAGTWHPTDYLELCRLMLHDQSRRQIQQEIGRACRRRAVLLPQV